MSCGSAMTNLHIYKDMAKLPPVRSKRASVMGDKALFANRRILFTPSGNNKLTSANSEQSIGASEQNPPSGSSNSKLPKELLVAPEPDVLPTCTSIQLPLVINEKGQINTSFVIFIASESEEGK